MSAAHRPPVQSELSIQEIVKATGYSHQAIEVMIRRGDFPPHDRIGLQRRRLWHKRKVLDWLLANEARIGAKYRACRRTIAELEAELGI